MKNVFLLFIAGLLSGVINALLFTTNPQANDFFSTLVLPGLVYGLVTGAFFIYVLPVARSIFRIILWSIASILSYTVAYFSIFIYLIGPEDISFALAGSIGALILCVAFSVLFQRMDWMQYFVVIATGAVVAYVVILNNDWNADAGLLSSRGILLPFLPTLYIAWQTAVTTVLGLIPLLRNNRSDKRFTVEVV